MTSRNFWMLMGMTCLAVANGARNDLVSAMGMFMIPLCILTVVFGGKD